MERKWTHARMPQITHLKTDMGGSEQWQKVATFETEAFDSLQRERKGEICKRGNATNTAAVLQRSNFEQAV